MPEGAFLLGLRRYARMERALALAPALTVLVLVVCFLSPPALVLYPLQLPLLLARMSEREARERWNLELPYKLNHPKHKTDS